jgi:hypothetical protein
MALVSTEAKEVSYFVSHEYPFKNLARESVTVTVAQDDVLKVGTILGKITSTGKYIVAVETATDGSEAFGGILVDLQDGSRERTFAAAGDVTLTLLTGGPAMANREALETLLDASYDDATKKDTMFAEMVTAGIEVAENKDIF